MGVGLVEFTYRYCTVCTVLNFTLTHRSSCATGRLIAEQARCKGVRKSRWLTTQFTWSALAWANINVRAFMSHLQMMKINTIFTFEKRLPTKSFKIYLDYQTIKSYSFGTIFEKKLFNQINQNNIQFKSWPTCKRRRWAAAISWVYDLSLVGTLWFHTCNVSTILSPPG